VRLRVAKILVGTEAEGPGVRAALWLQGCSLRCAACCNPEMLGDKGGEMHSVSALGGQLWGASQIEGITILGGEPFEQAAGAAALAKEAQEAGLSVMVFSGYTLDELQKRKDPAIDDLLSHCDLLVDGRYRESEPESERRWIGSRNQVMHFLSDRYNSEEARFHESNTVEIRFKPGSLTVSGWPSASRALDPRLRNRNE
jgi:anaerobic ribonucleoside-triphosphate reductase activating protein